jgi:hypothetical protein
MNIGFLIFALGCGGDPPPPKVERKPVAPKQVVTKKRPQNASADTGGAAVADLITDLDYKPERPTAFDDLEVVVDVERGDAYVDIDVRWAVNGKPLVAARSIILPNRYFSYGDMVTATVTVNKGDQSATLDARTVTIGNTPPRILTNPNTLSTLDGFRIRAEDPDGGRVSFHLKGGPPGMTLGEQTGVVRYKPSKTAEGGKFDIVIIARDEGGAESEWRFTITVSPGSESEHAKAERAKKRAAWEAERKTAKNK